MSVRQQSKHELVGAQQERYRRASRADKTQILDEFVAATGYHRKHALRWFRQGPPAPRAGHGGRPRQYDAVVIGALREVAEASDWLCGKRRAPFLAELVPALEAEGALRLEPPVRERLVGMSAARSVPASARWLSCVTASCRSRSRLRRSRVRTRASSSARSTGLVRKSSAPASSPRSRSVASSRAVTSMIGIIAVEGTVFSRRVTASPFMPGMRTSSRMRSGGAAATEASALAPSTASAT